MNVLPTDVIFNSGDPNECSQAYEGLPEPQKSLLGWLLHLMADVAALKSSNKMTEQNLGRVNRMPVFIVPCVLSYISSAAAIVVAPNLYDPPGSDPMEGLVMSQKAVQFLHHLILNEIELRQE